VRAAVWMWRSAVWRAAARFDRPEGLVAPCNAAAWGRAQDQRQWARTFERCGEVGETCLAARDLSAVSGPSTCALRPKVQRPVAPRPGMNQRPMPWVRGSARLLADTSQLHPLRVGVPTRFNVRGCGPRGSRRRRLWPAPTGGQITFSDLPWRQVAVENLIGRRRHDQWRGLAFIARWCRVGRGISRNVAQMMRLVGE